MRILLIGSGGREHALAWKLSQSKNCEKLYCAPGNAGIKENAECVDIKVEDISGLVAFAKNNKIDLVVVGPEAPLVLGLADELKKANIPVFGPSKEAARLEGSKGFMKDICKKYNIPTAAYGRFTDVDKAKKFIKKQRPPIVVKADGLAAGKGVLICQSEREAFAAVTGMLEGGAFGEAGAEVVIEEYLDGEEVSYFAMADGKTILPLSSAQDHKRVHDGDLGPNTGGMGAYSPAHMMNDALEKKIIDKIIQPTMDAMIKEGAPFAGVFFAGLMITDGEPFLIEYNVRFGDPECQTLMMRLNGDLPELLMAAAKGELESMKGKISWSDDAALCVVMAANGYPGDYEKNTIIKNIAEADKVEGAKVFHAGTAEKDGKVLSVGGRVLGVTATGRNIAQAQARAYKAVDAIEWKGGFCRRDIGWRALLAQQAAE